ncbi:toxin-antitoxin system, antitoxin component, PHD family [Leptospira yanagawae serovar Saopaulo str. Sao Paulo = ATCC 700523]|uniref:Toxin-antitoxin system, antitoxin component, PHD family n=1 Tax=Leptospira yanagawae serovar Saopaulo str. Sao Paulo = ATCC 700523 TaxID=1249483 RepID=A0A5E8H7Q9_9LEPT|nr:type II toxin-antitoxin system Phd/YefM family antitoxin [Leptospira yanagawae]EOQ86862.1 toxin-antitoxin system, antitoxin component, PHD family [Leptospira yanagawae serovar Saopaulo str. Sao Paulo = ATCC 700523]
MKSYPVGELKSNLSNILELVQKGKEVEILFGKNKKPVAKIVPLHPQKKGERKLGILKGKSKVTFAADFKMTEGE